MTKLHDLHAEGQSVWFDFIRRALLTSGELKDLVDRGVRGVTSNPSIFEQAIARNDDYDGAMRDLVARGLDTQAIYEALAIEDIQNACDILRPVFDEADAKDGHVSFEVSPLLAHDTEGTVAEARRLWAAVDRPNLMIKVPITPAGVPAIEQLIADGINVNVTLIFSLGHYVDCAEAFIRGLQRRADAGEPIEGVASVASFFVSRLDTAVDKQLAELGRDDLFGKAAVDNARVAYVRFGELFSGDVWDGLAAKGAQVQRVLWASTGTKNPAYTDTLYVDELIGPDTVNTVPPKTLDAFFDHGTVACTVDRDLDGARERLATLATLAIDIDGITDDLQKAGVDSFAAAFESLLGSIEAKRGDL